MAQFPGSIPAIGDTTSNQTLAQAQHNNKHQILKEEVIALAGKVGIDGSTDNSSHSYKLSDVTGADKAASKAALNTHVANTANPHAVTKSQVGLSNVDNLSLIDILSAVYPVGSIYFNATNNTNPATLLGFGTWVAFGAGRVPVGIDPVQAEFDTLGETGGAKTHILTTAEMPNLQGTLAFHGGGTATVFSGMSGIFATSGARTSYRSGGSDLGGAASHDGATVNVGGGGAHNNLQPYVTVVMWRRTA